MTAAEQLPPRPYVDEDPLEIARLWVRHAAALADEVADHERREPGFGKIHAEIIAAGPRQHDATQRAGYMALVSLAGDVRRIADRLDPPVVDYEIADDRPDPDEDAERRWAAAEGADD